MPFIPFGETQEIVGGFQVEAAVRSKPCSSCSSLKLRCFEPALSGCFLKIPKVEFFHYHALHTTLACKTPQYSFNPAPFASCSNFSTAFPQGVNDTFLEFLHNLRRGIAARQGLDFAPHRRLIEVIPQLSAGDILVVTKLDRLARSTRDLLSLRQGWLQAPAP